MGNAPDAAALTATVPSKASHELSCDAIEETSR